MAEFKSMEILVPVLFFVLAAVFIGSGIYWLTAPIDSLWEIQERALLARGLAPQRSAQWESQSRARGIPCLIIGFLTAGMFIWMVVGISRQPVKMSDIAVEGRKLTQDEADCCHHNVVDCVVMYAPRK